MIEAIEAFQRWLKRFGARPWEDELQKAFEAGYRTGANHHDTMKAKPRARNPNAKIKLRTKPVEPKIKLRTKPIEIRWIMLMTDKMRTVLEHAKQKLQLYRAAHNGEYVGGVEYTQLIAEIDAALSDGKPKTQFSFQWAVETVLETFKKSEADGYRSRDRQYAIEILGKAVEQSKQPIATLVGEPLAEYEKAARKAGWNLIPDEKGGRFERSASDESECVWLCGDWKQLCEFADIELVSDVPRYQQVDPSRYLPTTITVDGVEMTPAEYMAKYPNGHNE